MTAVGMLKGDTHGVLLVALAELLLKSGAEQVELLQLVAVQYLPSQLLEHMFVKQYVALLVETAIVSVLVK